MNATTTGAGQNAKKNDEKFMVVARAYGSSANMKALWDIGAISLTGVEQDLFNEVTLTVAEAGITSIREKNPEYASRIPTEFEKNIAGRVFKSMMDRYRPDFFDGSAIGIETETHVTFPAGMGCSGATNAATARATAELLKRKYGIIASRLEQAWWACKGEEVSAGTPHSDNSYASYFGGCVLSYRDPNSPDKSSYEMIKVPEWEVTLVKVKGTEKPSTGVLRSYVPKPFPAKVQKQYAERSKAAIEALRKGDKKLLADALWYEDYVEMHRAEREGYGISWPHLKQFENRFAEKGVPVWVSGAGPYIAVLEKPETAEPTIKEMFNSWGYEPEFIRAKVTNKPAIIVYPRRLGRISAT